MYPIKTTFKELKEMLPSLFVSNADLYVKVLIWNYLSFIERSSCDHVVDWWREWDDDKEVNILDMRLRLYDETIKVWSTALNLTYWYVWKILRVWEYEVEIEWYPHNDSLVGRQYITVIPDKFTHLFKNYEDKSD